MLKHKNFQVLLYKKEGLVLKHISSKTHDLISAKRLLVMRIRLNILLSCLDCGPSPLLLHQACNSSEAHYPAHP